MDLTIILYKEWNSGSQCMKVYVWVWDAVRNHGTRHTFTICSMYTSGILWRRKWLHRFSCCTSGVFVFLTKARLFTPGNAESFDSELAEMMNTKLEGSWSRESVRATMDTWQKLKATLPWNVSQIPDLIWLMTVFETMQSRCFVCCPDFSVLETRLH